MNSPQTQEQRRMLRQEPSTEGAFLAKSQPSYKANKKGWKNEKKSDEDGNDEEKYSTCQHYKKTSYPHWRYW